MNYLEIDGNSLTCEDIKAVACKEIPVRLTAQARKNVELCRAYVEEIISEGKTVYGLTTGFGKFSNVKISPKHLDELQENLIKSHAINVGQPYSKEQTRAIMLLRANVLAKGYSGIKLETLQTLLELLNKKVHPVIPRKGSVGASGDLSPLSHLALVLIGRGKAEFNEQIISGAEALAKAGIKPVTLSAKEGLALNNGTQVMTAIGVLTLLEAEELAKSADIIAAMTVDALLGTPAAFDPLIHKLRPHQGQSASAANLKALLKHSPLRASHINCDQVQDPYSLRCTPQVHGAVRDALAYVRKTLATEINSATDNPLIFPKEKKVISGGNFHGEPLAIALDTLAIAVSELGSISERRIEQMLNPALNRGLPPFLASRPGLDSGFMITQLTAAAAVSENKVLAHPASVDSIPTSANQEDHVSMGSISANKALEVVENVNTVLAIELMIALQALDYRKLPSSPALEAVRKQLRKIVKPLHHDREMSADLNQLKSYLKEHSLADIVSDYVHIK
ncbi:MAG TPA: histidine ammonia-lyase [Candidatus Cloacimonadota bacterium]|nr:histidine ammonia-lyase [Candidatus Cloacimonadota bacterium]HQL14533.1 histidine ammonia-lyase [Candidatus Cloacimonadota bacterium]